MFIGLITLLVLCVVYLLCWLLCAYRNKTDGLEGEYNDGSELLGIQQNNLASGNRF